MSGDGSQPLRASAFESARPEADLEGRLVLEAMRGALFGERDKPVCVGRYELIERIGSGALGLVVAARDPELDRRVAIKLLPARLDSRKLLREARALARLSSPHVVALLDVGTFEPQDIGRLFGGDPGDPAGTGIWLAMELVEGTPLDTWISRGPHAWREVLDVFQQAGKGLADAHDARIVHRDFKPANVILGDDNRVRVVDFGLARSPNLSFMTAADDAAADDDAALSRGLIGTPAYMSPEQHMGESADERADQFSFCVSMFEALYGEVPYPGPRYEDFMRDKNEGPPAIPTEPEVPVAIRRALTRGLSADPGKRFDSMPSLLSALTADLGRQPKRGSGRLVAGGLLATGLTGAIYLISAASSDCVLPEVDPAQWDKAKATLISEISGSEVSYSKAAAFRVKETLDQRQAGWSEMRAAACQTVPIDRATEQCLVLSMRGIDATIQWLSRMTPERISEVETLLEIVPDARGCLDSPPPAPGDGSIRAVDIRHRILVSRLQARSGKGAAGHVAATAARHAAEDLGFDALVAEAVLAEGESTRLHGDLVSARLSYEEAYGFAVEAGHTRVAALAAAGVIRVAIESSTDPGAWIGKASDALGDVGGVVAVDVGLAQARGLAAAERWDDAIVAYERVRKAVDASSQDVPPTMKLVLYDGLAEALLVKGRRDEATAQADHALALAESAFGPGHPTVASALTRLGTIALQRGEIQEAENRLRRALELRGADARAPDGEIGDLLLSLAIVVSTQGGHDEARSLLERAIASPNADRSAAPLLGELCRVLMHQGELATAQVRCKEAIAAHREHSADDHAAMLQLEQQLGQVLLAQGELHAAERRLSDGLVRVEKYFGPGHPRAAPILIVLAELREKQARSDDAVALLDRVAALSSTLGAADHDVVTAVARRAWLLTKAGRAQEVLAVIRTQQGAAGDGLAPIDRFELAFAEAGALWGAGDREDALATANRARQDYGRSDRARPEALARVDRWLAGR